jgi:hypothetical protein
MNAPPNKCRAEGCDRLAMVGEFCVPHYRQRKRHPRRKLRPLRTRRGQGERLSIRMPRELREAAAEAARHEGVDEPEWWRRAGEERLRL